MPPLSSASSSQLQLSYEGPLLHFAPNKPLHHEMSFLSENSIMEVKPRLDLWSDNANVWSLSAPQPKKKGVSFNTAKNQIHEIIHVTEYTAEEIHSCWYSRAERRQMVANRNACVARLDAWLDLPQDEAFEGLERTVETRRSIQHIAQAVHAVLAEQYDQRMYGMQADAEYIALRYSAVVNRLNNKIDMPNPVGILTASSVRYHEVAPMA